MATQTGYFVRIFFVKTGSYKLKKSRVRNLQGTTFSPYFNFDFTVIAPFFQFIGLWTESRLLKIIALWWGQQYEEDGYKHWLKFIIHCSFYVCTLYSSWYIRNHECLWENHSRQDPPVLFNWQNSQQIRPILGHMKCDWTLWIIAGVDIKYFHTVRIIELSHCLEICKGAFNNDN